MSKDKTPAPPIHYAPRHPPRHATGKYARYVKTPKTPPTQPARSDK